MTERKTLCDWLEWSPEQKSQLGLSHSRSIIVPPVTSLISGNNHILTAMNFPSRNMMILLERVLLLRTSRGLAVAALVMVSSVPSGVDAAVVAIGVGELRTERVAGVDEVLTTVAQTTSDSYDLSDLAGLVEGSPIQLGLSFADGPVWAGNFAYLNSGEATVNLSAAITLEVGSWSASVTTTDIIGPFDATVLGGVTGFVTLPQSEPVALTIPWGTDLSAVVVRFSDGSSISGEGLGFGASSMEFPQATLTSSSVPEPSVVLLTSFAGVVAMRRRRRVKSDLEVRSQA